MEEGIELGQYIMYLIVAAFILAFPLTAIRGYTSTDFYDALRQHDVVQDYLLSRAIIDCLSSPDKRDVASLGSFTSAELTDARLRGCTPEPVVVTLRSPHQVGIIALATDPSLKQHTSLSTLRQEYVLLDGKRALLTVSERHA